MTASRAGSEDELKFGHLNIDPVTLGSAGNGVLGIRDSGKTYTATWMAERLFEAGVPFIAFDPIGVWRFLRVPGYGKGYPIVVAGGQDGDLPLSPASAPAIVEAAMQNGISLVIDLFSMELSKADWRRIVRDSVRLLLHRNNAHGLRHVFIEEAAEFVPQQVRDGDVYAEVEKLARMGGNARLGYTLINQRAEEVNKAVLELCDNLFLHRQKGRNSLTALSKWLDIGAVKDHKSIIDTLSTLPTGECWAWLGGSERPERVKVPKKNSLHPDRRVMRGDEAIKIKKAVDVGQFVNTMREAIPAVEAEAKANDPKALKAEIARLRAEKPQAIDPETLDRQYHRGKVDGYGEGVNAVARELSRMNVALSMFENALQEFSGAMKAAEKWKDRQPSATPAASPRHQTPAPSAVRAAPPRAPSGNAEVKLNRLAERKVLQVLAVHGMRTKRQLAIQAGYAAGGGGFLGALSKLKTAGLIHPVNGSLSITDAGVAAIGDVDPLPTGAELVAYWMQQFNRLAEREVLRVVIEAYPNVLRLEDVAARTNPPYEPKGGGFLGAVSKLRTLGLVEGRGELKANDELFGE